MHTRNLLSSIARLPRASLASVVLAATACAPFVSCASLALGASAQAQREDARRAPNAAPRDAAPRDDARRRDRAMPQPPDWPRAGGFGPERSSPEGLAIETLVAGEFGRRELTDEDLERAIAVAREVSSEWGEVIAQRAKDDPEQVKLALRSGARRLLALTALKDRAPRVFAAKVAELRAQGETMRAAAEVKRLESDPAAEATAIDAARDALAASAQRQVDATIAARAEELSALEQHLARMRSDLARDGTNASDLAGDVVKRALERAARRPGGPDGPAGDGPGRDGPGRDGPGRDGPGRDGKGGPGRGDRPGRPDDLEPPPPVGPPPRER